jgi:hypothetical protein
VIEEIPPLENGEEVGVANATGEVHDIS